MKNSIKLFSLLAIFAVTFASCKKDDDTDPTTTGGGGGGSTEFAVTVDGTTWSNITTTAFRNKDNRLIIEGKMGVESVVLVMPGDIAVGSYTMGAPNQQINYNGTYKPSDLADPFGSAAGTLKITAHDKTAKTIKGTYDFTATSLDGQTQKKVTGGSFDVTYTVQ